MGRPLGADTRSKFENALATDLGDVRVHTGAEADAATRSIAARAFTSGRDVVFRRGEYRPGTHGGDRLLAHELAHVLQQRGASAPAIQRQVAGEPTDQADEGPAGETTQAAVQGRSEFYGEAGEGPVAVVYFPTDVASLDQGDRAVLERVAELVPTKLLGSDVEIELDGYADKRGDADYNRGLSHRRAAAVAAAIDRMLEPAKARASNAVTFTAVAHGIDPAEQQGETDRTLSRFRRVEIDLSPRTRSPQPSPPTYTTLKEFIAFVETVQATYPSASPQQIVSEISQLWYFNWHWGLMIGSEGLREPDGSAVNLADTSGRVGRQTDVTRWNPNEELVIDTPRGLVNMGHVIAGIDATISGMEEERPSLFSPIERYTYGMLEEASGGDTRDFATWSGDLGQAYAEYLEYRWYHDLPSASLTRYREMKAPDDQLRADIHGYVATRVSDRRTSGGGSAGSGDRELSEILRDLYFAPSGAGGETDRVPMVSQFADAAGNPESLRAYVRERTKAFAKIWFYKNVGKLSTWDFETVHARNEAEESRENRLEALVDYFMAFLAGESVANAAIDAARGAAGNRGGNTK